MAEDKVKNEDLFAGDLFDTTKPEKYLETIELVELGMRELLTTSKNLLATNPFINSKNISDYAKIMKESIVLEQQLLKVEAEKTKALQQLEILEQRQIKTTVEKQKAEERYNDAIDKTTKKTEQQSREQAKLNSEYAQAAEALNKLSKRQMDNSIAGREMSKTAKLVADAHTELKIRVETAEQSVGRFNRNVGNYKSGYDGLGNSVNQLTREFPAFANSVQTGFMALSNNIPIFFDELKRANAEIKTLREQGENVPGLFSRFTSSIFSWGTALSVGVTLLTFFGKEIGEYVAGIFKADEAVELSAKTQSEYWTSLKKIIDRVTEAQLKYNVATGAMTDLQANIFRTDHKKDAELSDAYGEFNKNKKEIAEKIGISPDLVNGKLDTTKNAEFSNEEIGAAAKKSSSNPFKQAIESRKDANAAFIKIESELRVKVANIRKEAALEEAALFAIDAEKSRKEREKIEGRMDKSAEKTKATSTKEAKKEEDDEWKKFLRDWEKRYNQLLKLYEHDTENFIKENKKKFDDAAKRGENNTSLIIKNMALEASIKDDKRAKENARYQQELNDFKIQLDEKGNVTEESHKHIELMRVQHEKNLNKIQNESLQQQLNTTLNFVDQIGRVKNEALDKQLQNDLDKRQRNIEQQQQLAIAGKDNTLAFEKAAAAKDELEKQKLAKQEEKRQKALAFLKLLASYADKGDADQAVMKALVQMAIAGAVIGSYKDGVEGLDGPGTETSDSIFARLSKNESVVTAKGTKENPGLPTAINEGKVDEYFRENYLPKYLTGTDTGSFAENTVNSLLLNKFTQLNDKVSSLEKALKERPVHQTNIDELGNVIDNRIANGFNKKSIKKSNSPLNYI